MERRMAEEATGHDRDSSPVIGKETESRLHQLSCVKKIRTGEIFLVPAVGWWDKRK
jgi:hypothetical protein